MPVWRSERVHQISTLGTVSDIYNVSYKYGVITPIDRHRYLNEIRHDLIEIISVSGGETSSFLCGANRIHGV